MQLPGAFTQRIKSQFTDADDFLKSLERPVTTSVRKHPVKGTHVNLPVSSPVPWCNNAYYLTERPVFTLDPLFHAGAYYVQESSSMFLYTVLEKLFGNKEVKLLDLCAAPGGKSTLIASWLNGQGLLVSNEVIKSRAKILLENVTKWGYSNTWVTSTDPNVLGGLDEFFDAVVIDAPCSGEGLFRRDKSAIEEWSIANCELCEGRQKRIMAEILPAIEVGGYIIYSTCTFNPGENDENIKWMCKEFPVEVVELENVSYTGLSKTKRGGVAFYPHLTQGEGFYCCVLRKTDSVAPNSGIRKQKQNFAQFKSKDLDLVNYINTGHLFLQKNEELAAIPVEYKNEFFEISSITKILGGYLQPGELKGKNFIPSHSLAMSIYNKGFETLELDHQHALMYLNKKDFKIENAPHGWLLITHQNLPLGFIKNMGNRFNNYYPVEWRIRMDV